MTKVIEFKYRHGEDVSLSADNQKDLTGKLVALGITDDGNHYMTVGNTTVDPKEYGLKVCGDSIEGGLVSLE